MAAESRLEGARLSEPAAPAGGPGAEASADSGPAVNLVRERLEDVEGALRTEPHSFSFFQAVRLLERLHAERAPVGGYGDPNAEAVRFGVPPALSFPASEIQELDLREQGPSAMKVNFLGVTGPQGVLPHEYTLLVADRLRARDRALGDFLDMFHHRLLSLFYLAWRKYRFAAAREDRRPDLLGEHVLDLMGVGMRGSRPQLPFPVEALISRAGLLIPQPRGAAALQQLIEDFFAVPVTVEQFVGGWYPLSARDRCTVSDEAADPASQLGRGAVAGDEIWDQQARVRLRLGPLQRAQYDAFLPGGSAHEPLAALLRFFSHDQYEFEVQLVLAAGDVPGVRLGSEGVAAPRLGWSTWIRSQPRTDLADETILTLKSGADS
ncbi:MAG: type VI secretion system baseplate subunit TssG [Gemmatimonadetes bacterium]|nr:type VI secretion system baseplate subunit TssG [Gemmatimonadota bacterium]